MFMGCCLTSWFAKKQTALAISTTKAEYVFAGKACQQALWMKQALIDYGICLDDVPIMCDNKGAIDLSRNHVQHSRTKHIEIRHHFLSDNVQKGNISIEKVASEDNIANIFTKSLKREVFNYLRLGLGMMELIMDSLEPFLTLNEPICPIFVVEFYHSLEVKINEEQRPYIEFKLGQLAFKVTSSQLTRILQTPYALETFYTSKWSLNSLDDHPNSNFFGPKHDLVKKTITNPRTTQTQLLRDSNKLYLDEIRPELKGWKLFFKENFFCSLGKRNKVNACTAYMLYYLTIKRKFNFTLMLIYRMEEVKNKQDGPMPFAMLLTRLYNHILQTNPQAIVPPARFTFHEHVMDPLDISRNLSKEKGKKIVSSSVISSSSSSSNDNEAPSFLEFYDELSDIEKPNRHRLSTSIGYGRIPLLSNTARWDGYKIADHDQEERKKREDENMNRRNKEKSEIVYDNHEFAGLLLLEIRDDHDIHSARRQRVLWAIKEDENKELDEYKQGPTPRISRNLFACMDK
ncbi:hypothetical protein Tco_0688129 [Tanacetum coccineum]